MRQIIKNGTIVTGGGSFPADILIDGEKIAATGTAEEIGKLTQPGDREIDAAGCLIFPGFIDIFILPAGYIRNFLKIFIACSLLMFPITSFLKIGIWKIANSHGFIFFLYYLSCFPVTFHFRRINKNRYKKQHDKCKNAQIESFFLTFFSYLLFYLSVHSVPLFPS